MKPTRLVAVTLTLLATLSACSNNNPAGYAPLTQSASTRDRPFNENWHFTKGDPAGAEKPEFSDASWRTLNLPHDYSIEGPFDQQWASATAYLPGGLAWYRKTFDTPEDAAGKLATIHFDGVYKNSTVYLNGHLLGNRPNGYVPLEYDMTPYLNPPGQKNLLAVRVDHADFADSRWYPGSGIYRNVYLRITDPVHVEPTSTFITTQEASKTGRSHILFATIISNGRSTPADVTIINDVRNDQGKLVASSVQPKETINAQGQQFNSVDIFIDHANLWSPDHPAMYEVVTRVMRDGAEIDRMVTPFGIRDLKFNAATGLTINGDNYKMKGVCLHEDAGALGSAIPVEVWERRLQLLKAAGTNAIRTSHNPPAPEFLDLCDKMGFLVMDEAFDEWTKAKKKWVDGWNGTKFSLDGYAPNFEKWADRDIQAMVLRDRNHPSIIMWSIGNEVDYPNDPYPLNDPELLPIAERLVKDIKAVDTTRPVTAACAAIRSNLYYPALDIVGYNYQEQLYAEDHAAHPERIIYGSENKHDLNAWLAVEQNPYISGQFLWTGFDYLGEARPWPGRSNSAGILDLAGFPKPTYYFRQSLWTDKPMVYMTPERAGVRVYTNCPTIELFQSGKSLGEKNLPAERTLNWPVDINAGDLRIVGKKDGNALAEFQWIQPGPATQVTLKEIPTTFGPGIGPHVAQFEIRVTDANDHRLAAANNEVTVTIDGPGRLLGLDTGDNSSHESFQADHRQAYQGRLVAYIETRGPIRVTASAPGLEPAHAAVGK